MKDIIPVVLENKKYDVVFGDFESFNPKVFFPAAEKCLVVTDSNVDGIYGLKTETVLSAFGGDVFKCVLDPGEKNKNLQSVEKIINDLGKNNFSRSDAVLAVGGGVVSDMAGFAAGVFKRGIKYATVPTTLLAMIDASVGGKTGFDTAFGKNTVGLFNQPEGVFIDTGFLRTLPEGDMQGGMAEAVKCGIIAGGKLWQNIVNHGPIDEIIRECVNLKAKIVSEDEYDNGKRHLLNLGHTLGHAVEKASDYSLSHGFCVAIGISCIYPEINDVLESYGLPTSKELKKHGNLFEKALDNVIFDKKAAGDGVIDVVTVKNIGDTEITRMSVEEFRRLASGNI